MGKTEEAVLGGGDGVLRGAEELGHDHAIFAFAQAPLLQFRLANSARNGNIYTHVGVASIVPTPRAANTNATIYSGVVAASKNQAASYQHQSNKSF